MNRLKMMTIASIDAAVEQLVLPYYTELKVRGKRAAFHGFQSEDAVVN